MRLSCPGARTSGQKRLDHPPVHVGEAAGDAIVIEGEPLVVQAEEVQGGGVEIVNGDGILQRLVAYFVGEAVSEARLEAGAGQPAGELLGVVVPALFAGTLGDRGSAEFGDTHDQGVL